MSSDYGPTRRAVGAQTRGRILNLCRERPRSVGEMAFLLGMSERGVRKQVTRLVQAGHLTADRGPPAVYRATCPRPAP
jgi:predicted ArsR family transcriptional regulator